MSNDPIFGSTRDALRFALTRRESTPSPVMNRMMADGKVQRLELADGTKITVAARRHPRSEQLRGLDGAATAGMVLAHVARLPEAQQLVLKGRSMLPTFPCACKAPCCSGSRPNPAWMEVVRLICEHLKEEAKLSKIKGKKGLSTHPLMRQLLVHKYLQPKMELTLVELAQRCDVSEQTIFKHSRPIVAFLTKQEDAGWAALDRSLNTSGMVGFIP